MKLEPFKPAQPKPETLTVEYWTKRGLKAEDVPAVLEQFAKERIYLNNVFQVNVQELPDQGAGWPPMVHLSIKRRDKKQIHDWRIFQQIKNMLVGTENEAVELYPAESRLVDTANQYHLWALADPAARFPFGYVKRAVSGPMEAAVVGARQAPLPEGTVETPEPPGAAFADMVAP